MSSLKVYCDDSDKHPHCAHGPTLLFSRQIKGKERKFYACSAYRDRKDCAFFMWEDEKLPQSRLLAWRKREMEAKLEINHEEIFARFQKFISLPIEKRNFCHTCFTFIFPYDNLTHDNHKVAQKLTDKLLFNPTHFINPIVSNKKEAQFWFSENSKEFIIESLKALRMTSCLCVGAPSIHELVRKTSIKSLLLDIDKRYHYFFNDQEFGWFNMMNCHFFANPAYCIKRLENFLSDSGICVVIDPPFGARLEPLANTVEKLQKLATSKLNVFLILPYFMEKNVITCFQNYKMLDYRIEYSNHCKFRNKFNGKEKNSPIRIFTNVSPKLIILPETEGYYYCNKCECWKSKNNKHCDFCNICPSKNGDIYVHCHKCSKCVKFTWLHCSKCKHCCIPNHQCSLLDQEISSKKKKIIRDKSRKLKKYKKN